MSGTTAISGIILIAVVLWDAFETVVFPRRVTRRFRLARLFYRNTWRLWRSFARVLLPRKSRENFLSYYGPLSLLLLIGFWALMLVTGFALLYWTENSAIKTPEGLVSFGASLYFSGTTFFTLGLGDITPLTGLARALIGLEAGMGFGFLAIVISYLPAVNQSFSRREVNISLLDARAGSPPTAGEMLRRHAQDNALEALTPLLHEWERWSADLLESHLSFPMLAYFRSQHDNQSWLAALTTVLDTCALVIVNLESVCARQAQLTFSMARHAVVDLALVLQTPPREPGQDRLNEEDLKTLRSLLGTAGMSVVEGPEADRRLEDLRGMYEPYVYALSERLLLPLPPWYLKSSASDNWQVSAWNGGTGVRRKETAERTGKNHF
jgi:hypothetical protein